MAKTTFIGDCHGKFNRYNTILKNSTHPTIQVGDMGVGFFSPYGIPSENPPYDRMVEGGHRFIRGNHDNPNVCKKHTQWIPDGTIEGDVMFIGGGLSIDREFRNLNESYWEDEELSITEFFDLTDKYLEAKPCVMVTHDCPETVAHHLFKTMKLNDPSRTRQAFESMWQMHKPELWVFGHWHDHRNVEIMGTRFVCLGELQTAEVDLDTLEVNINIPKSNVSKEDLDLLLSAII